MGRAVPVVLILAALAATIAVSLQTGVVNLSSGGNAKASPQQAAAVREMAANQRWAAATCSTVIGWKSRIERDLHGMTLSLGAIGQVQDAIGATNRMVDSIGKLGLPPALQGAQTRVQIDQLRSEIQSQVHDIESAANSVATGDLGAIGTLLSRLGDAPSMEGQVVRQVRDLASELGVSWASSPQCRQLVGTKL